MVPTAEDTITPFCRWKYGDLKTSELHWVMGAMITVGFVREISDDSFLLPFSKTFLLLYPEQRPGEEKQLMNACCGPWAYFFRHIVLLHPQGNPSR